MVRFAETADSHVEAPLVAHLVYSFNYGGLQSVLAECINRIPVQNYRHVVICLTGHTNDAGKINRTDVGFFFLNKPPGNGLSTHLKLFKLLRQLRPAILHTYNIGTIEYSANALLAGVPARIHAEHGRDSVEIDGNHGIYNLLRRILIPVIDAYVPVSADLSDWLCRSIGVPRRKIAMVTNGVDTARYAPLNRDFIGPRQVVWIGTVGRADQIKNHAVLLDVFAILLERFPGPQFDLRLAIVGDGPLLETLRDRVVAKGWVDRVWLPGARDDVADIMRTFSIFVLPSLSEATPIAILEAMATGLPVVATRVGGVPELVLDKQTGFLVNPSDLKALADAISAYIDNPKMRLQHGDAGRQHVCKRFSVDAMAAGYESLYSDCRVRNNKRFTGHVR